MAFVCAFCRHANPTDAKFCNECGNTLRLRPCARCDAVNDVDAAQCHFCGTPLSVEEAAKPKQPARERAQDRETAGAVQQGTGSASSSRAQMAAAAAPAMRTTPRGNPSPSRPASRETRSASAAKPQLAAVEATEADERLAEESSSIIRALELASREPSQMPAPIKLPEGALPARRKRRLRTSVVASLAVIAAGGVAFASYFYATGGSARFDAAGLRGAWSAIADRLAPGPRAENVDEDLAQRVTAARPITTVGAAGRAADQGAAPDKAAPATQAVHSMGDTTPAEDASQASSAPDASSASPPTPAATTSSSAAAGPPTQPPAPSGDDTRPAEPATQPSAPSRDDMRPARTADAQPKASSTKEPRANRTISPRRESRPSARPAASNAEARTMEAPIIAPAAPAIVGPCTAGVAALGLCQERGNAR